MNIKKLLNPKFYFYNWRDYHDYIKYDKDFNSSFRNNGKYNLSREQSKTIEYRSVVLYRKYQCNQDTIWGYYYRRKLNQWAKKTGVDFQGHCSFGKGLIIGHWGRIIINGNAVFGDSVMLTHGVTVGRDIRGRRAGTPRFGNKICIRANSTVVGGIVVGDDVLIAPNTFVNFDVPSHSIVIGNPATVHYKENATEGHIGTYRE